MAQLIAGVADRTGHSRRPIGLQKKWRIEYSNANTHRDRGARIRIRIINVPVRVNAVQIRHAIRTPVVKLNLTLTLSVILTLLGPVN